MEYENIRPNPTSWRRGVSARFQEASAQRRETTPRSVPNYQLGTPVNSLGGAISPADKMKMLGKRYQTPDNFNGGFGEWDTYRDYWHRLVEWNEWPADIARQALLMHVKGDALTYLLNLPDYHVMTHNELIAALEERYGAARIQSEEKL